MSAATPLYFPDELDDITAAPAAPAAPVRHLHAVPVPASRPAARPASIPARGSRPASVSVLLAPAPQPVPVRLTRRGVVVIALAVAALGAALVWLAALSAPSAGAGSAAAGGASAGTSGVTVESGDTLWTIAGRVAPATDPRVEVERLRGLNHLDGVALVPGQHLRVH